jgi:hypothetical protein
LTPQATNRKKGIALTVAGIGSHIRLHAAQKTQKRFQKIAFKDFSYEDHEQDYVECFEKNTCRLKRKPFRLLTVTNFQSFGSHLCPPGVEYAPMSHRRYKKLTKKGGWSYFKQ